MPEFRPKSQLNIGAAPQHRVDGLAGDIANLFGAVKTGVEKYVEIGETAAELEFNTQKQLANQKLVEINTRLAEAQATDDHVTIAALNNEVTTLTTDVTRKRKSFEYSQGAYDKYNNLAIDYGTSVSGSMFPQLQSAYAKAYTSAKTKEYENNLDMARVAKQPTTYESVKALTSGLKEAYIDPMDVFGRAAFNNMNVAIDDSGYASQFAAIHGLMKQTESGTTIFNEDALPSVVDYYFGSHAEYKMVKEGGVEKMDLVPKSSMTTTKDLKEISDFLKRLRVTYTSDDGEYKNPEYDSANNQYKKQVTAHLNGEISDEELLTSSYKKTMDELVKTNQVSKSQAYNYQVLNLDMKENLTNVTMARGVVEGAVKNDESLATLTSLLSQGDKHTATMYQGQVNRLVAISDESISSLSTKGEYDFKSFSTLVRLSELTPKKSSFVKKIDSHLNGKTVPSTLAEAKSVATYGEYYINNFPSVDLGNGLERFITSDYINGYTAIIDEVEAESKRAEMNPEETNALLKKRLIAYKPRGKSDKALIIEDNNALFKTIGTDELDYRFTNLGNLTRPDPTVISYLSMSYGQSFRGDDNKLDNGKLEDAVSIHGVRISTFLGDAVLAPKLYNSKGKAVNEDNYINAIEHTLRKAGKDIGYIDYDRIRIEVIHPSNSTDPNKSQVKIYIRELNGQKEIVSQVYDGDSLSRLMDGDLVKEKKSKESDKLKSAGYTSIMSRRGR